MNKTFKYILYALAALVVLVVAVAVYIALTFDPNPYKPQLISFVKEQKQRTLTLEGDIKLSFFPKIGIDLGKVSLSEKNSSEEFAAVDRVRLNLALLPLLKREVVVDEIRIDGMRAKVIRHRDGTSNYDDLAEGKKDELKEEKMEVIPFALDVSGIKVTNSTFTWQNEEKGRTFAVSKLEVSTGRLGGSAPTDVDVSFRMQSDKPKIDAAVHLTGGVALDMKTRRSVIKKLVVEVKDAATGRLDVTVGIPALESTPTAFRAETVSIEVNGTRGDNFIKGRISTPVSGDLETKRFDLPHIQGAIDVTNPKMPKGSMTVALSGSAHLDMTAEKAGLNLTSKVDESTITSKAGMEGFDTPWYTFEIGIDRLDADRYLPPGEKDTKQEPEKPLDLSALKTLRADGNLRIGDLKAYNVKATNIRVGLKAAGGRMIVRPMAASLYQGTANGALTVNAAKTPHIAVQQEFKGVNIGPLMRDALNKDVLEGRGNVSLNVTGEGETVTAIKKALDGSLKMELRDGAIKGINIPGAIRAAKAKLGILKGEQTQTASAIEKTDFSEMKAVFVIKNGVAHDDLSAKSPLVRLAGTGDIDIGGEKLDYLLKATVVATLEGQGGKELAAMRGITVPVRISGPFAESRVRLDFNAMVGQAVKQQVETVTEEIKTKGVEKLKEGFRGLFK